MQYDDGGVYKERLEVAFLKLQLRAELYQQPEKAEHQAGMIIEQVVMLDCVSICLLYRKALLICHC